MAKTRRSSNAGADHRSLYKRTSISRTPDELIKRRVAINESLRKKHREQLITAKRFRNLTRTEELESAGEEEPESEKNQDDGKTDTCIVIYLYGNKILIYTSFARFLIYRRN